MPRLLRILPLALAAALGAGCVSAPPACVTTRAGTVCASTEEKAAATAARLDELADTLHAKLPGLKQEPIEVWLQEQPQVFWLFPVGEEVGALTNDWSGRIHCKEDSPDLDTELAHEMVHALLDESWDALPATLEEGLCDQVAVRVARGAERLRAQRLMGALIAADGPPLLLRLKRHQGGHADHEARATMELGKEFSLPRTFSRNPSQVDPFLGTRTRVAWYGAAYIAVGRLLQNRGYAGLRALSAEAGRLPEEEAVALFMEAAGLDATHESWQEAILAEATPAAVIALCAATGDILATRTLELLGSRTDGDSLWQVIEAADPRLVFTKDGPSVVLLTIPEFVRALEAKAGPRPAHENGIPAPARGGS